MTLGIAWVRKVGLRQELIVTSDSRLTGGQSWDGNPKIMLLPRTDCVLSYSGNTYDAYSLMLQAYNAIKMFPKAENRQMDIVDLKGHLIRVFNHSRKFISHLPARRKHPDSPDVTFILSGYSWKTGRFHIWTIHYDESTRTFTFRPTSKWRGQGSGANKIIAFIGDKDAVTLARQRLSMLLRERGKISDQSFDMEPFEVLRDVIREELFPSVGGPVQLVKLYESSNVTPIGVYWPSKAGGDVCVLGRPLMDYELSPFYVIDPDNPTFLSSERAHEPAV